MPYIDASHYQHELDSQARVALKSRPEFSAILDAFMREYDPQGHFAISKVTHVEITPQQLSEYYEMVPPICERLGIDMPTLLLANDPEIKAQTLNEASPMIIMNSGVLLNCSEDTIRAMFAHECGHIASHHVMYQTLGKLILDGTAALLLGLNVQASIALKAAYLKWNRASELTADRAAAIALGSPSPVKNMCLELAGSWECFDSQVFTELFIEQAAEYQHVVQESIGTEIFEIILRSLEGVPTLNAYRAHEIKRWCEMDEFENMQRFLRGEEVEIPEDAQAKDLEDVQAVEEVQDEAAEEAPASEQDQASDVDDAVNRTEDETSDQSTETTPLLCCNCGTPYEEGQAFCEMCGARCA